MGDITPALSVDFKQVVVGVCIIIFAIIAVVSMIEKISVIINKPVKWLREKNNDHKLLMNTVEKLDNAIVKHNEDIRESSRHDNNIEEKIEELTRMFVDKQIEDARWEVIDFASRIAEGWRYTKDAYQHVLRTYEKYEKIIEENGLTNGEVEISIEVIKTSYKEKLQKGF